MLRWLSERLAGDGVACRPRSGDRTRRGSPACKPLAALSQYHVTFEPACLPDRQYAVTPSYQTTVNVTSREIFRSPPLASFDVCDRCVPTEVVQHRLLEPGELLEI